MPRTRSHYDADYARDCRQEDEMLGHVGYCPLADAEADRMDRAAAEQFEAEEFAGKYGGTVEWAKAWLAREGK